MKLGMQVGLGPGHIVLDRDSAPLPKKGWSPRFSAHVGCGQMAAWIKISLDMKESLGPSEWLCVRWGPAPRPQTGGRAPHPIFVPCLLWPNSWMHQDAILYVGRPQPSWPCLMGTQLPRKKWHSSHPVFGPCLLWPNGWMDQDATCYRGKPRPRDVVLDGVAAPP